MDTIDDAQRAIVDEFAAIDDWQDRYRKIIALGRSLPEFPEEHRLDTNLVKGCQNRVWLHASLGEDGRVHYVADSEAMIVRGLIALLLRIYNDHSPADILATQPTFIQEIELGENLSQNRANGLASVVKNMKFYALAFQSLQQQQGRA